MKRYQLYLNGKPLHIFVSGISEEQAIEEAEKQVYLQGFSGSISIKPFEFHE